MGYKFEKYSIGGGGSGGGEYINMECYFRYSTSADSYHTMEELFSSVGFALVITYYVVDALPENPNVTDLTTGNPTHIYFYNDVPYLYGNVGYGNMWLGVTDVLALFDIVTTAKGFTSDITKETEEGVYVTYQVVSKETVDGLNAKVETLRGENATLTTENEALTTENANLTTEIETLENDKATLEAEAEEKTASANFTDYGIVGGHPTTGGNIIVYAKGITNTEITSLTIPSFIDEIFVAAFDHCPNLEKVVINDGPTRIQDLAFYESVRLKNVTIPTSVTQIDSRLFLTYYVQELVINYTGTKEQWKAIVKADDWDNGTPNYIIYCTDGTIAKDGTET